MKNDKFIVTVYDDSEQVVSEQRFKSYREIAEKYNIEYHQALSIHKYHEGKQFKFMHATLADLVKKLKIVSIKKELNLII